MQSFKKFIAESGSYCSDKCCGADVKAEDCKCPADCPHCDCNSVSESVELEEVEQVDEISKGLAQRYMDKASKKHAQAYDQGKRAEKHYDAANKAGGGSRDVAKRISAGPDAGKHRMVDKEKIKKQKELAHSSMTSNKEKQKKLERGMDNAKKRGAVYKEEVDLTEEEINNITAEYINENNITLEDLENMSQEQLDEIIGKAIGGAFKVAAKTAVGAGRMAGKAAKKAANRMSTSGRADAAEKRADSLEKKKADRERLKSAKDRVAKAKKALRDKQQAQTNQAQTNK